MSGGTRWYCATEALCGDLWGATKRLRGVPKWAGERHAVPCHGCAEMGEVTLCGTLPVRPSVELPVEKETREEKKEIGEGRCEAPCHLLKPAANS
eukprot:2696598-Pyramimonas_sp.AAC.1